MNKGSIVIIYDIANAAKVSMVTVSRVLNYLDKFRTETRENILKIIDELGYIPNTIVRKLATKKL